MKKIVLIALSLLSLHGTVFTMNQQMSIDAGSNQESLFLNLDLSTHEFTIVSVKQTNGNSNPEKQNAENCIIGAHGLNKAEELATNVLAGLSEMQDHSPRQARVLEKKSAQKHGSVTKKSLKKQSKMSKLKKNK